MKLLTVTAIHRCSTICCFDFVYAPILENKMSNGSSGYYQFDTVIEELNKITTQDHNSPFRVRVYTYLISTLTYFFRGTNMLIVDIDHPVRVFKFKLLSYFLVQQIYNWHIDSIATNTRRKVSITVFIIRASLFENGFYKQDVSVSVGKITYWLIQTEMVYVS